MMKPELKRKDEPMPVLQMSKAKSINAIEDNGRILQAEMVEIYTNEIDLQIICEQYKFKGLCTDVYYSEKGLPDPDWYGYQLYNFHEALWNQDKCELKDGDPVLYSIAKSKLNALYGMTVQKPVKQMIDEDY